MEGVKLKGNKYLMFQIHGFHTIKTRQSQINIPGTPHIPDGTVQQLSLSVTKMTL